MFLSVGQNISAKLLIPFSHGALLFGMVVISAFLQGDGSKSKEKQWLGLFYIFPLSKLIVGAATFFLAKREIKSEEKKELKVLEEKEETQDALATSNAIKSSLIEKTRKEAKDKKVLWKIILLAIISYCFEMQGLLPLYLTDYTRIIYYFSFGLVITFILNHVIFKEPVKRHHIITLVILLIISCVCGFFGYSVEENHKIVYYLLPIGLPVKLILEKVIIDKRNFPAYTMLSIEGLFGLLITFGVASSFSIFGYPLKGTIIEEIYMFPSALYINVIFFIVITLFCFLEVLEYNFFSPTLIHLFIALPAVFYVPFFLYSDLNNNYFRLTVMVFFILVFISSCLIYSEILVFRCPFLYDDTKQAVCERANSEYKDIVATVNDF